MSNRLRVRGEGADDRSGNIGRDGMRRGGGRGG